MIDQLDGDDTDVFQKSLIDRYRHGPEQLRSMCLAEFAATHCTCYHAKDDDEVDNGALPDTESQSSANSAQHSSSSHPVNHFPHCTMGITTLALLCANC